MKEHYGLSGLIPTLDKLETCSPQKGELELEPRSSFHRANSVHTFQWNPFPNKLFYRLEQIKQMGEELSWLKWGQSPTCPNLPNLQ
jgi:hypothetical protein